MDEQTVIIVERAWGDISPLDWGFCGVFANLDSVSVKLSRQYRVDILWVPETGQRVGVERSWNATVETLVSRDPLYFRAYEMIPMDLMGRQS